MKPRMLQGRIAEKIQDDFMRGRKPFNEEQVFVWLSLLLESFK